MKNFKLLILSIFVFSSLSAFTQSNEDCPSCDKEQATFDSINSIYNDYNIQIKKAREAIKKDQQDQKDLDQANQKLNALKEKFAPIKSKRDEAFQQLDFCFAAASPAECKKCKEGKEVNDDGALCDDGDPCTKNDRCVNGVCIGDPVTSNENPDCGGKGK